jgi:PHD/YefM family antitoxin component YafN of YafNO toxin-antitoxin module
VGEQINGERNAMVIHADALESLVSITQFNKGQAAKIFGRLKTERQLIVLKNNTPAAVVLSPDEFVRMSEAAENLYLLQLADERLDSGWEGRAIAHADFWATPELACDDSENAVEPELE